MPLCMWVLSSCKRCTQWYIFHKSSLSHAAQISGIDFYALEQTLRIGENTSSSLLTDKVTVEIFWSSERGGKAYLKFIWTVWMFLLPLCTENSLSGSQKQARSFRDQPAPSHWTVFTVKKTKSTLCRKAALLRDIATFMIYFSIYWS